MQGHRVDYDDGDCLHENLTHRTHRLPDLAGDTVFNPEADAESPAAIDSGPAPDAKPGRKSDNKPGGRPGTKSDVKHGSESDMKSSGRAALKYGMALKGQRIEVWWAQDEEFYAGIVTSFKKVTQLKMLSFSHVQDTKAVSSCFLATGAALHMLNTCVASLSCRLHHVF